MKITEIKDRTPALIEQLLSIWESAIRVTHSFLTEKEMDRIREYVPNAISDVPILIIAENESGIPISFMGISNKMLEMLFVSDEYMGQGIGKQLLQYGIEKYNIDELAVNEQNPAAKGFYEHMGFEVCKRTESDGQGKTYPLLYMKLKKNK